MFIRVKVHVYTLYNNTININVCTKGYNYLVLNYCLNEYVCETSLVVGEKKRFGHLFWV